MQTDLHVTWMTPATAERHERAVMNVPSDVQLGWTPYHILIKAGGGVLAHTAFTDLDTFRRWLTRHHYRVALRPYAGRDCRGEYVIRTGRIVGR